MIDENREAGILLHVFTTGVMMGGSLIRRNIITAGIQKA
jgi:hypothetical protein